MKKTIFSLSLLSVILVSTLAYVLYDKGSFTLPKFPTFDIPEVSPVPSNTMINESTSQTLGEETRNDNAIVAEGVSFGGIKQGTIEASNFKFTPDAISVNQGDTIIITVKSVQGLHDFVIDELDVKSKTLTQGESEEITFVATKKGTFQFYSSVGQHRSMGMVGTIVVN